MTPCTHAVGLVDHDARELSRAPLTQPEQRLAHRLIHTNHLRCHVEYLRAQKMRRKRCDSGERRRPSRFDSPRTMALGRPVERVSLALSQRSRVCVVCRGTGIFLSCLVHLVCASCVGAPASLVLVWLTFVTGGSRLRSASTRDM